MWKDTEYQGFVTQRAATQITTLDAQLAELQKQKELVLQQQAEAEANYTSTLTNITKLGATLADENSTAPTVETAHQLITTQVAQHLHHKLENMDYAAISKKACGGTDMAAAVQAMTTNPEAFLKMVMQKTFANCCAEAVEATGSALHLSKDAADVPVPASVCPYAPQ